MNNPMQGAAQSRERARFALQHGDPANAERAFVQLLQVAPNDPEAVQFLASRHVLQGQAGQAVALLAELDRAHPNDPATLHQLGAARMETGDMQGAVAALRAGLRLAPDMPMARLRLSMALDQLGDTHAALVAAFGAVNVAQARGRWLSDETTAPALRDVVKRAMRYISNGRHELFGAVLESLQQRYGKAELARVEQCLAIYLGERGAELPDPRQVPKFMYFPGIPSQPYYPRERFPWYADLEAHTAVIREELRAVLSHEDNLQSFLQTDAPRQATDELLRASGDQPAAWDAYFFHRHGERYKEHCAQCPQTVAVLDRLPLAYVRDHSPEALFSVLRPGSHILPHRGVTNTRLVTHLPLIVPADCALNVSGEIHAWQEGRCVTFDDTFEHEAWNRSGHTRVVLIVDTWNPDLTEVERIAIDELVGAIGDFNRASDVPMVTG